MSTNSQIGEILAVSVRMDDVAEGRDPTLEGYYELLSAGKALR